MIVTGHNNNRKSGSDDVGIVVIGAGPAGMVAANMAAAHGATTVLLDEQPSLGGQIYRDIEKTQSERPEIFDLLSPDYHAGATLVRDTRRARIHYISGATVWNVETDPSIVYYSVNGKARKLYAKSIIIATGAMERSVPIPGWTLPGVMGAGAAQVMLKSCGMVPDIPIVIAGAGPLLLLVADQLSRAGCDIAGIVETTRFSDYLRAAPYLPMAMRSPEYLKKGLALRISLRKSGIPVLSGATDLQAMGDGKFTMLQFKINGRVKQLNAGLCLLHEGVVPNVQLTRQIGVDHEWYARQDYWRPVLSKWGETSRGGVFVAGDGGGIDGAVIAAASGQLSALKALHQIGRMTAGDRNKKASTAFRLKQRHACVRPMLDTLFGPPRYVFKKMNPDTIICRCSEVTAREICQAVKAGCHSPDQVKSSCRCGMGPCQGRMCGLSVSALIANELGRPVTEIGYYKIRSPIKPLPLKELASLEEENNALDAG